MVSEDFSAVWVSGKFSCFSYFLSELCWSINSAFYIKRFEMKWWNRSSVGISMHHLANVNIYKWWNNHFDRLARSQHMADAGVCIRLILSTESFTTRQYSSSMVIAALAEVCKGWLIAFCVCACRWNGGTGGPVADRDLPQWKERGHEQSAGCRQHGWGILYAGYGDGSQSNHLRVGASVLLEASLLLHRSVFRKARPALLHQQGKY